MNINNNLINIIYKTAFEKYLDYEYLISILKENYNKLLFLGNKRNYNSDNINNKNKINNEFVINDKCAEQNDEIRKFKEIRFYTENSNNIINRNNDINLKEEEELGDIKKVIRYKKTVYVNKLILKEKNDNKIIRKKRDVNYKRISKYRGVSKNGAGWQTLMMYKNNKPYIGTYNSEELAARIYDIASIKKNGIKSKTNYLYTNEQIDRILKTDIDFKAQNISKIISELIN